MGKYDIVILYTYVSYYFSVPTVIISTANIDNNNK